MFGLAQGEPEDSDIVIMQDDMNFAIEQELADVLDSMEIDYYNGWLRKGFVLYPNGIKGSC